MLRNRRIIQPYPNKSVIEDMITRLDGPSENTFTPFKGCGYLINQQFRGQSAERFNMEEFIDYVKDTDFNPSKVNTKQAVVDDMLIEARNAGFTRLEDMSHNEDRVIEYIRNMIIGYKKNSNSPYNQMKYNETRTFYDEEGEQTPERDLLMSQKDYDIDIYKKVIAELPYLLKIINSASRVMHAHLFSFLRAYVLITRTKTRNQISPRDYANYVLYRVKSNGQIDKRFDHDEDNKGVDYPAARAFIQGSNPQDPAYKACMRLIADMELLDIDIANEDPLYYIDSYVNSLVCEYLPTNTEYIKTFGAVDPEIMNALQPENLFARSTKFELRTDDQITLNEYEAIDVISTYISSFHMVNPDYFSVSEDKSELVITYVEQLYSYIKGVPASFPKSKFSVANDIFKIGHDWLRLPAKYVGVGPNGETNLNMLFTIYGLCILITPVFDSLYYVKIEDALTRLEKLKEGVAYDFGWYID